MKNVRLNYAFRADPVLLDELHVKSALTGVPVNDLLNEAVADWSREDDEDLAAFEERAGEAVISMDELLKGLKVDGRV